MAHVIAVAGKGGVGKTTLCGMLIQYLCEQGKGPTVSYTHLTLPTNSLV